MLAAVAAALVVPASARAGPTSSNTASARSAAD
jgi:hypothetical protein